MSLIKLYITFFCFLITFVDFSQSIKESFENYPLGDWKEKHTGTDNLNQTNMRFHKGKHAVRFNFGRNSGVKVSKLISKQVLLPNSESELRFWEYNEASSIGYNYHGVWISVDGKPGIELKEFNPNKENKWVEHVINLSKYKNKKVKIQFVYKGQEIGLQDAWNIDDIYIGKKLLCLPISNVKLENINSNSVKLNWSTNEYYKQYNIVCSSKNSTLSYKTNAPPYIIESLKKGITYKLSINGNCPIKDEKPESIKVNFKTSCSSFNIPYKENFQSKNPTCWTGDKGKISDSTSFLISPSSLWNFNNEKAQVNVFGYMQGEWLISPSINLGRKSSKKNLIVDLGIKKLNKSKPLFDNDDVLALVISTDNGRTWSSKNILAKWDHLNQINLSEQLTVNLKDYSGIVKFAFYANSKNAKQNNIVFIERFDIK